MPYLLVGWLWYLGMLVPVIGLLQVGGASMADRYTYLPQIGLAIAVVWTVTVAAVRLSNALRRDRHHRACPGGAMIDELQDSPAISSPDSLPPPGPAGRGGGSESGEMWEESVAIAVQSQFHRHGVGGDDRDRGHGDDFIPTIVRFALALVSVAILTALAAAAWRQTTYWRNNETLWTRELSFPQYDNAVALQLRAGPGRSGAHQEAVQQYEAAVAIDPTDESSHLNLGLSYEALDSADAAIGQYRAMIGNDAKSVAGHNNLARLLQARGDDRHAAEHLRAAHDEEPSNRDIGVRLALLLATSPDAAVRNGPEALALARRAVELSDGKDAAALDAQAAAEAETGDFKAATRDAKSALELATAGGDKKLADEIRLRLDRYSEGRSFRAKASAPLSPS